MIKEENPALSEAQGLLEQLRANLAGKNGYVWLEALKKFNRQEIPTWSMPTNWKIWETLSNGFFKSINHVKSTLEVNGMEIWGHAETMARRLNFGNFKPYGVDIAMVDIIDLGFDENQEVSFKDINKAAKKKGLEECTPYDAFEIRLKFTEQPIQERCDEFYLVVMRTIKGGVFHIMNTGGHLVIGSLYPNSDTMYNKHSKFFFRLISKK
jgi:hypothetical protein